MYGPASLRMYFRLIVQDVAVQYYVQHMDAHSLRNDKSKAFFDLTDCDGVECLRAIENNYEFVLQLCATMAGATRWPPHGVFKASKRCI